MDMCGHGMCAAHVAALAVSQDEDELWASLEKKAERAAKSRAVKRPAWQGAIATEDAEGDKGTTGRPAKMGKKAAAVRKGKSPDTIQKVAKELAAKLAAQVHLNWHGSLTSIAPVACYRWLI